MSLLQPHIQMRALCPPEVILNTGFLYISACTAIGHSKRVTASCKGFARLLHLNSAGLRGNGFCTHRIVEWQSYFDLHSCRLLIARS